MSLLVPAALGLAALAGPLLVLYMLRSRRRRVVVSSTLLWERTGAPVSSAVPWQRLRLTPLLLLQLAVLAAFVLSLARPFYTQETLLGPHTVLVIDTSGSMSMAGRLDRAKARALDLVSDVSAANLVSVVEAGPAPRVEAAFAQTAEAVAEAIESLRPTGGAADLSGAVRLARGLATPDRPTNLVLFTDGGDGPIPEEPVVGATHLPFDETAPNVSISTLTADPSTEGTVRLFVAVTNHSTEDRTVRLEVLVGDLPSGSLELEVAGGGTANHTLPVDAAPGEVVSVGRVGEPDGLALDDRRWLVLGSGPERTVAIAGEESPFVGALVEVTPGFSAAEGEADVQVVDGGPLPEIERPAWLIRPDRPPPGIEVTELVRNAVTTYQRPGDPILDSVDLSGLAVAEAQVVETTDWVPLVRAGDVPLVLLGEVNGYRVVYFTFDLTHSNLPVQVGFPIMGARLLEWLAGSSGGAVSAGVAGEPIPVAPPAGSTVEVELPSGEVRRLEGSAALFNDTGTPGVYRVRYVAADGSVEEGPVAVRGFHAAESAALARSMATTGSGLAPADTSELVREWAPWVVAAVLGLMAVEWWVGHQRPGLRRRGAVTA